MPRVLVYTLAMGFVHRSIAVGATALLNTSGVSGLNFDTDNRTTAMSAASLAKYDAVVLLSTTGTFLEPSHITNLQASPINIPLHVHLL